MNADAIKGIFESLLASVSVENQEAIADHVDNPFIKAALAAIDLNDPHRFRVFYCHRMQRLTDSVIELRFSNNPDAKFLYSKADFIEHHIRHNIEKHEGSACCADKTRTIMRALAKRFSSGEKIVFDYGQEYTYHLPEKILNSDEAIMSFFRSLLELYYGKSDGFAEQIELIDSQARGD
ncbi:hypothetical protein P5704_027320 (plasmid) [Pseudomonas sp. FeN3W]|nr:hypothetical protein P5704_027320 [Pseudomonas sp. FeN3W]